MSRALPGSSFFDAALWQRAGWSAVAYRWHAQSAAPPVMGIVFGNDSAGEQIFMNWIDEFSNRDQLEAIRVSIIEADIVPDPRYCVHLAPDPLKLLAHAASYGAAAGVEDQLRMRALFSRINPSKDTIAMLPRFKIEFAQHREFLLAPVTQKGGQLWFNVKLGIMKRTVHFRHMSDVTFDDPDAPALTFMQNAKCQRAR